MKADFSGYASRSGLLCSDGRVILAHAFKDKDKQKVPLVWSHDHSGPDNILGHAYIEDREDGTYTYGFFNETEQGKRAKHLVQHGDVEALSVFANRLKQKANQVEHGNLVEVSLVLAGANPGAFIDNVALAHADGSSEILDDAAIITMDSSDVHLKHEDDGIDYDPAAKVEDETKTEETESDIDLEDKAAVAEVLEGFDPNQKAVVHSMLEKALAHEDDSATTTTASDAENLDDLTADEVQAIIDGFTPDQELVIQYLIGMAISDTEDSNDSSAEHSDNTNSLQHGQDNDMGRNAFDQNGTTLNNDAGEKQTLSHSQIETIFADAAKPGETMQSAVLKHAQEYGITNIELLFPDAKASSASPELIARQADWVPLVLNGTKHIPFSKVKTTVADLTAEEARAKGYIKGTMKKDEVISLLRRTTGPTTIYKKQRLDRDDIIDITDFDAVAWLKWEIRFMLNEELARAILIGDGRENSNPDKIKDPAGVVDGIGVRSIANENELFAIKLQVAANTSPKNQIIAITKARVNYRGSGSPSLYTTDETLINMLLIEDKMGRRLYDTEQALAAALRVKEIITVPVMEEIPDLVGIVVNLVDYSVGSTAGGELTFFEDFDIDFNQNKYLLETRVSGALTKPKSAIVIRQDRGTLVANVTAPSFNGSTNTITIPSTTGVNYLVDDEIVTGNKVITKDTEVVAEAKDGYYLDRNATTNWNYTYTPSGS